VPRSAKNSDLIALGKRIRAARQELSWSQEDLADKAEIDRSYIGGVERGERNVSFTTLCRIARALESDVACLAKGIPHD
jgi:transcriptional regulator with XRE-family HTH domain